MSKNIDFSSFPYKIILDWYKKNGRDSLPWRQNQDPYFVWISEIFLQQTQVNRVIPYFEKVTSDFQTIHDFARLSYEDFFPYYEWLGYYSRAKNMLKAAQIVSNDYDWYFPQTYKQLLDLPWIWPYTAQAILSFWHNQNILAFDTNIEKIFARYYFGSRFVKLSNTQKAEIQTAFERTWISWRDINAAMMDFASIIDINDKINIQWEDYPLTESLFFKEKWVSEKKVDKVRQNIDKKDAEILVFLHEDHKEYYSSHPDILKPFKLWKTSQDHRHFIKDIFKEKYNLSLSVRPAYKKITSPKWNYFFYHAQIQTWEHSFWIFSKKEKKDWENIFLGN